MCTVHLYAGAQDAAHVLVVEACDGQIRAPLEALEPAVRLPLRVDQQRPAVRVRRDDRVLRRVPATRRAPTFDYSVSLMSSRANKLK